MQEPHCLLSSWVAPVQVCDFFIALMLLAPLDPLVSLRVDLLLQSIRCASSNRSLAASP